MILHKVFKISPKIAFGTSPATIPIATPDNTLKQNPLVHRYFYRRHKLNLPMCYEIMYKRVSKPIYDSIKSFLDAVT